MSKIIILIFFFNLFFTYLLGVEIKDEFDVSLDLIKHQPCTFKEGKSKWNRKLEFEAGTNSDGPKLIQNLNNSHCYNIGGRVQVFSEFKGEFSVYLELRSSTSKKNVPESCVSQKPDGCGGVGSCLYCDACESLATSKTLKAKLLLDKKPIGCGEGLQPGTYDNLALEFCLPELDDILQSQGLTRETFKSLTQADEVQTLKSLAIFATVYIFDKDVKKLMQTQIKVENVYRKSKRTFFRNEPLPPEVYWTLPFNTIIKEQKIFVACHKIYGNVKIKNI